MKRGDVVAIIGGSFSGIALACSLALADDVIIYIFERERRLLHGFLDKSHRHLSRSLNSRSLGRDFAPGGVVSFFEPPIFRWEHGCASDVAWQWIREFEQYASKLPIFVFTRQAIAREHIREFGERVELRPEGFEAPLAVDIVVDATGFGDEANPHHLKDHSYWRSGHRLIYDHLPPRCKVLISGCGDSGVIEGLHYAIEDFDHEQVERLWPESRALEAYLDYSISHGKLDEIFFGAEFEGCDERVLSEVSWWVQMCQLRNQPQGEALFSKTWEAAAVFRAIDNELRRALTTFRRERRLDRVEDEDREAFALTLSRDAQLAVRREASRAADSAISENLSRRMNDLPLVKFVDIGEIHRRARAGVELILNGRTPTPYTRSLSPYNIWLMRILMSFPNVSYRRGEVSRLEPTRDGRFRVAIGGRSGVFDRVITRYGVQHDAERALCARKPADDHGRDWLLENLDDFGLGIPTDEPSVWRAVAPATYWIRENVEGLPSRRAFSPSNPLNKAVYMLHCLGSVTLRSSTFDRRYNDPPTWLAKSLRAGRRPAYIEGRPPRY